MQIHKDWEWKVNGHDTDVHARGIEVVIEYQGFTARIYLNSNDLPHNGRYYWVIDGDESGQYFHTNEIEEGLKAIFAELTCRDVLRQELLKEEARAMQRLCDVIDGMDIDLAR